METKYITTSNKPISKMEKLESSYNTLSNGIIKPLFAYISRKVERCAQVLQNEIMGDGRIRNSSSTKASTIESGKTMAATSEPTPSPMNTCNNIESNNDESTVYSAQVRDAVKCPIKPTLVFRINSSCSITSMEVTNLEWNADGTSLCMTFENADVAGVQILSLWYSTLMHALIFFEFASFLILLPLQRSCRRCC